MELKKTDFKVTIFFTPNNSITVQDIAILAMTDQ